MKGKGRGGRLEVCVCVCCCWLDDIRIIIIIIMPWPVLLVWRSACKGWSAGCATALAFCCIIILFQQHCRSGAFMSPLSLPSGLTLKPPFLPLPSLRVCPAALLLLHCLLAWVCVYVCVSGCVSVRLRLFCLSQQEAEADLLRCRCGFAAAAAVMLHEKFAEAYDPLVWNPSSYDHK